MKVALCLYGQPRFVTNPYVVDGYKKNIIGRYNSDVYCHSWNPQELQYFNYGDWSPEHARVPLQPNAIPFIIETYKPKACKFEVPKEFNFNENAREHLCSVPRFNRNNEIAVISHLYSLSQSIDLVDNIEDYDFVVVSRYDTCVQSFTKLDQLNVDTMYLDARYRHFCDVLMFGSPEYILTQSMYKDLNDIVLSIKEFSPEDIKQAAFNKKFHHIERCVMDVSLARSYGNDKLQY